jgi:hypothetical protein
MGVKMKKVSITKVNSLSLGKVMALVAGVSGLFFGFSWMLLMGSQAIELEARELMMMLAMILIIPVIYGIIGFITGLIAAIIFNSVSGYIGGLEMEVEEI